MSRFHPCGKHLEKKQRWFWNAYCRILSKSTFVFFYVPDAHALSIHRCKLILSNKINCSAESIWAILQLFDVYMYLCPCMHGETTALCSKLLVAECSRACTYFPYVNMCTWKIIVRKVSYGFQSFCVHSGCARELSERLLRKWFGSCPYWGWYCCLVQG